ncbi:MAG: hypothetical protein JW724_02410 [Candidatus Altiarchaeota archaeon]|nr:hypothetical protein [Candidatus Altiarchaeota archaeon]
MNHKLCFIYSIATVFLLLSCGCTQPEEDTNAPKLEFSPGPCDKAIDRYSVSDIGVRDPVWTNRNTTLEVKAYLNINCDNEIEEGYGRIEDDKIILVYRPAGCKKKCSTCMCIQELRYRIDNIKRKDYEFELLKED